MYTADMQKRLHQYLGDLGSKGQVTKEVSLGAPAGNDDALRTMISDYIPEGTYPDLCHAITLIPGEAWQAVQGDVWRGEASSEDAHSGFGENPVAKLGARG